LSSKGGRKNVKYKKRNKSSRDRDPSQEGKTDTVEQKMRMTAD